MTKRLFLCRLVAIVFTCVSVPTGTWAQVTLLNVSYDPTRELYADINTAFARSWKARTNQTVTLRMSHGGSGAQARAVIDGLDADVVTLALAADIDAIAAKSGLLSEDWRTRLPNGAVPYTSTIVFLVRKGNPKAVKDWPDLIRDGISVIAPNPKTSGGARYVYLAAWGAAAHAAGGDDQAGRRYVEELYAHVPILDSGARGATITFTQRGQGDVLLAWEDDAKLATKEAAGAFEIVAPPYSIQAEPVVAWIDANVGTHHTQKLAEAYLRYLYMPEAQEIIAQHGDRPIDPEVAQRHVADFAHLERFTVDASFGGWQRAQQTHFADGGIFDQINQARH